MSPVAKDRWAGGESYELFMGRWSRFLAQSFVDWLAIPPERHWLEIGCGTGSLTAQVCERSLPASVLAIDSSPQFVAHARASLAGKPVEFLVAAAEALPERRGGYDAVVSSLVLNFLPDPRAAAISMRKVVTKDGVIGACVWDYAAGMGFRRHFWDAAVALDPTAHRHDEGERFAVCSPDALEAVFRGAGFGYVNVDSLEIVTHFRDFDDFWRPFNGGPGPAPAYLSDQQRALVRRLQSTLPREPDGSILLTARAWAVRAQSAA
jgi:SAM-dependent methyltransferase